MNRADFEQKIVDELEVFSTSISAKIIEAETHHAVIIDGVINSEKIIKCIAVYMVALISNAIEANLKIHANLIGYTELETELLIESVLDTIGENNDLNRDFIEDERNPWLAEALVHLLLFTSRTVEDIHPVGRILALGLVHDDPKDKGLDLTALYMSDSLGLTIGECKAYKTNPNKAISNAMTFFEGVDSNRKTGRRIRSQIQILRKFIPEEIAQEAPNIFWKNERCFLTTPVFDASVNKDWSRKRNKTLGSLQAPVNKRLIIPISIVNFEEFFNELSDEMRRFSRGLSDV